MQMRIKLLSMLVVPIVALGTFVAPASANSNIVPFIRASDYKKNLSFEEFRANPRIFYRSEAAFQLSRQYAESVTGQSLTSGQFTALLQSDMVRVTQCLGNITTGAMRGEGYYWIDRPCRKGEEIIQVSVGDLWVDFISLNCLNTVEDKTPQTYISYQRYEVPVVPVQVYVPQPPQKTVTYWQMPGYTIGGSIMSIGSDCPGQPVTVIGTPSTFYPGSITQTTDFGV